MNASMLNAERAPRLLHPDEAPVAPRRGCFSELIHTLFLGDADTLGRSILFTSPQSGAGVSFICSSVATELAGLGGKVLLVEAQTLLRLARRAEKSPEKHCARVDLSRLWLLGPRQAGDPAPGMRGDVASVGSVLAALRQEFTQIVIDAPAISSSDDALALAAAVHGTVLVAQAGATTVTEIDLAHRKFVSLGGKVLGSIYNAHPAGFAEGPRA